ncbi:MAG: hypothetical protein KKD18_07285 [Nanoarchaeota archaeon]|nr:hypothetical protein [Nanoarchaeota archaeon]
MNYGYLFHKDALNEVLSPSEIIKNNPELSHIRYIEDETTDWHLIAELSDTDLTLLDDLELSFSRAIECYDAVGFENEYNQLY